MWFKKLKLIIVVCLIPLVLAGCRNSAQRADTQDTWSSIQKRGKVVIGLDDSFVPMGFREKSGNLTGYDVDLAKAVFRLYGIKADFQSIDWSMKETELRNGTIDALWNGYSITKAREKKIAFSRPYLKNSQVLVTKKQYKVASFADMKNKSVGLQDGSTAQSIFNDQPSLLKDRVKKQTAILYDTFPKAFIDLNADRIQGILMDKVYADYYIKHQKNSSSYRIISNPQVPTDYFGVGMRKGDVTLKKKINAGLERLKENGQLEKINQKWFGKKSDYLGPVKDNRGI